LQLVRANVLTEAALIAARTANPAAILGLNAGQVSQEGAGIIVIDPQRRWTVEAEALLSYGKNTPFLGREMEGSVVGVHA
jgi:dihydroorotase